MKELFWFATDISLNLRTSGFDFVCWTRYLEKALRHLSVIYFLIQFVVHNIQPLKRTSHTHTLPATWSSLFAVIFRLLISKLALRYFWIRFKASVFRVTVYLHEAHAKTPHDIYSTICTIVYPPGFLLFPKTCCADNKCWFRPLSQTSSSCRPSRPCLRCSSSSRLFASPERKAQTEAADTLVSFKAKCYESVFSLMHANEFTRSLSSAFSPTSSFTSFLTCFRLALRSMDTLCLEPSRAANIASADIRTFFRTGFLKNFPFRSWTFDFRSSILRRQLLRNV